MADDNVRQIGWPGGPPSYVAGAVCGTFPDPPLDPLLAALIGKLPPGGTVWPAADRKAWLTMMEQAFAVVYGVVGRSTTAPAADEPAAPRRGRRPKPPPPTGPRFYIDHQGIARRADGAGIMPHDVTDEIVDLRGQNGDLATIVWADGSTGIPSGVSLNITVG